VVPVGLDDANLIGANFLVYAKLVNVSDSWVRGVLREECVLNERLSGEGARGAP